MGGTFSVLNGFSSLLILLQLSLLLSLLKTARSLSLSSSALSVLTQLPPLSLSITQPVAVQFTPVNRLVRYF